MVDVAGNVAADSVQRGGLSGIVVSGRCALHASLYAFQTGWYRFGLARAGCFARFGGFTCKRLQNGTGADFHGVLMSESGISIVRVQACRNSIFSTMAVL